MGRPDSPPLQASQHATLIQPPNTTNRQTPHSWPTPPAPHTQQLNTNHVTPHRPPTTAHFNIATPLAAGAQMTDATGIQPPASQTQHSSHEPSNNAQATNSSMPLTQQDPTTQNPRPLSAWDNAPPTLRAPPPEPQQRTSARKARTQQ